jgi:hypothetical protein
MAEWKAYHFRCPSLNGSVSAQFYKYLKAFLLAQGWELHDSWGAQTAQYSLGGSNYWQNNETVTIEGKVYTFKTTLTPAEGEVLIGANLAASYDNFKLAINRTDPGTNDGVKYKIAEANPNWEATTNTDTGQTIVWRGGPGNSAGNVAVLSKVANWQGWSALTWGVDEISVWKSRGESGLEPYGYVCITPDATASTLRIKAYQYWDAGSHTGTRKNYEPADSFYLNAFSSTYDCIIAGDKDLIYLNNRAQAGDVWAGWFQMFGHMPRRFCPDLITTTGDIVAGSNVSIPVTDSSKVPGIGGYFQILGLSEGCDRLQVASIPDSTHVVVVSLPRNYASGATIGLPASTFFINNSLLNSGYQTPFPVSYFSDAGLTVGTGRFTMSAIDMRSLNLFYGKYVMTPFYCCSNTLAAIGWLDKGMFYYAGAALWDVACENDDGSIITTNILATSATNLTLVDSTKSWTPDEFIGKFIVLVGGTGIGQVRKITDNDGTTLTIGYAWYINPDATTTFRIYDTVYRYLNQSPWTTTALLVTDTETPPV